MLFGFSGLQLFGELMSAEIVSDLFMCRDHLRALARACASRLMRKLKRREPERIEMLGDRRACQQLRGTNGTL
jgi:hypothetical protein